jgi:hypothetical protein
MTSKSKSKKSVNNSNNVEYLKNKFCKLTPLFDIDYTKKTNFLSTCLFDMKGDSYRSFDKYLDGIKTFKRLINEVIPDWKLRIFIDDTITENKTLMKELSSPENDHVQLVKYSCPSYLMNNNSGRHKGVFGTILRLFPFFNFPNNDAGIVICDDLDWVYKFYAPIFINKINLMNNIINNNGLSGKNFNLCVKVTNHYYENINKTIEWVIMSSFISYNQSLDKNLLYDFFSFINKEDSIIVVEHYLHFMKGFSKKNFDNEIGRKFTYGFDEYCLNYFIVNKLNTNIIKFKSHNFFNFINLDAVKKLRHVMYKENDKSTIIIKTSNNNNNDNNNGGKNKYIKYLGGYYNMNNMNNMNNSSIFVKSNLNHLSMKDQEILHDKYIRYLLQNIIKSGYKFITYTNLYTIINDLLYNKFEYGLLQPLVSNKISKPEYISKITTFTDDIIYTEKFDVLQDFYYIFFKLMLHINNSKKYNSIFTKLRVNHILKKENFGVIRREYIEYNIDGKKKEFNFLYKKLDDKTMNELNKLKLEKFTIKELL